MTIHIIVTAYALADDLFTLYESCAGKDVRWHLFQHSAFADVDAACQKLNRDPHVFLYAYKTNRGLARSWNEGWLAARNARAGSVLIANDDAVAGKGDLYRLVQAAAQNPDAYLVSGWGYDLREQREQDMMFSLAVVNDVAFSAIGMFDENFYPIYYEDVDWCQRGLNAGLHRLCSTGTHIVHAGSKTLHHSRTDMETHHRQFKANQAYYIRKWGADKGEAGFLHPFNDPAISCHIPPGQREAPYPGFNRPREEITP